MKTRLIIGAAYTQYSFFRRENVFRSKGGLLNRLETTDCSTFSIPKDIHLAVTKSAAHVVYYISYINFLRDLTFIILRL